MKESKEAMKLALEFVEYHSKYWNGEGQHPQEIATALREALAEQPAQIDCCANCLSPKREHKGEACPKPYTTVWHAWDYNFPPKQKAQQLIHCKHKRENGGVCPHHNLQCGWPKCNEQEQPTAWVTAGSHTVPLVTQPAHPYDDETEEPCPSCGKALQWRAGGGVVCSAKCGYWFCF